MKGNNNGDIKSMNAMFSQHMKFQVKKVNRMKIDEKTIKKASSTLSQTRLSTVEKFED